MNTHSNTYGGEYSYGSSYDEDAELQAALLASIGDQNIKTLY
jgi:hypothetical protein